ncbi:MAG: patatin-like phospholipase family protein [Clostridia bacterium]|nr:patatin-like phospholipase family protein [Clostridia bacterium]
MRGLALEGGGARGAFQVGAIKALYEMGYEFDAVAGTSIGSINGALIAIGDIEHLEEIWEGADMAHMVNGDAELIKELVKFEFKSDINKLRQLIVDTIKQGGLDVTPFRENLRRDVDEAKLRASKMDFGLVTLSLTDLKPIEVFIGDIPEGKLHDYILASANYPAFKNEKFDNKKMLDGAFFDNLPINMLIERGCDEIVAIKLNSLGRVRKVPKDASAEILMIEPSEDLGKVLDVDQVRAKHNIKLGYYDTMRVLKKLKGNLYYIDEVPNEDEVLENLLKLPKEALIRIKTLIGSEKPVRRMVFEEMLPMIAEFVKSKKEYTYSELMLNFYEQIAEQLEIDRFQILTFKDFVAQINEKLKSDKLKEFSSLDDLSKNLMNLLPTKGYALLPHKTKSHLLVQIFYILFQNGFWEEATETTRNMI